MKKFLRHKKQGGPGSVRLRFGDGTVRAVPVFGSGGSSAKRAFSVRGIPSFCPSNSEPGACNPCFEAQNGRPRKHPGTTPGRSNSPKTDIRPTGFNMTGFRCLDNDPTLVTFGNCWT